MRKKIFVWLHDIFCILLASLKMVAASTLLELIWKNTISPYCYILVVFFVIDGFINMWETTRYV